MLKHRQKDKLNLFIRMLAEDLSALQFQIKGLLVEKSWREKRNLQVHLHFASDMR